MSSSCDDGTERGRTKPKGYQYRTFDLFAEDEPETWARGLADEGWEFAVKGTGVLVKINGVVRRRYYLRRAVK